MKFLIIFFIFFQNKNPIKAAFMSTFIPGLGQVYTGNYIKGAIFFISEVYLLKNLIKDYPEIDRDEDILYRFSYNFVLAVGLWSFNIADAYVSAHLYKFEKDTSLMGFNLKREKWILLIEKKF